MTKDIYTIYEHKEANYEDAIRFMQAGNMLRYVVEDPGKATSSEIKEYLRQQEEARLPCFPEGFILEGVKRMTAFSDISRILRDSQKKEINLTH